MIARQRRRGATYTMFILVFSVILLATGSLYVDASKLTLRNSATQARTSQLREAAFAGVRWAGRAADRGAADGKGRFDLHGSQVSVTFKRVQDRGNATLEVTATAKGVERTLVVEATLRSVEDAYRLEAFRLR